MNTIKKNDMNKIKFLSVFVTLTFAFVSCETSKLITKSVAYQSVRTTKHKVEIPNDAKISVGYSITPKGELVAVVRNLTNEIMIIDQTKSFFVNSDGTSKSYYDPTIRTTSTTNYGSTTDGVSVNLGSIASAIGIGGALGRGLNGINVGESNTMGSATTNTTYFADQPQIMLAPNSSGAMSKCFQINGVGKIDLRAMEETCNFYTSANAPNKFNVCISYSIDDGETFEKIITSFYVNSVIVSPVKVHGRLNDALRKILSQKTDAIHESWWLLYAVNTLDINDNICNGVLIDYQ